MRRFSFWSWLWFILGVLYFFLPLYATLQFSLQAKRGTLSLLAYQNVLNDPKFYQTFLFSLQMAVWTVLGGIVLIVPTAYWVHLRLPRFRPFMELMPLMPFVIPAVVLVFGLIRAYSRPPLLLVVSPALLVAHSPAPVTRGLCDGSSVRLLASARSSAICVAAFVHGRGVAVAGRKLGFRRAGGLAP